MTETPELPPYVARLCPEAGFFIRRYDVHGHRLVVGPDWAAGGKRLKFTPPFRAIGFADAEVLDPKLGPVTPVIFEIFDVATLELVFDAFVTTIEEQEQEEEH